MKKFIWFMFAALLVTALNVSHANPDFSKSGGLAVTEAYHQTIVQAPAAHDFAFIQEALPELLLFNRTYNIECSPGPVYLDSGDNISEHRLCGYLLTFTTNNLETSAIAPPIAAKCRTVCSEQGFSLFFHSNLKTLPSSVGLQTSKPINPTIRKL